MEATTAPTNGRQIFSFFDGTRERSIDPLAVMKKMREHSVDFGATLTLAESCPDPATAEEAWTTLIGATRDVFDIEPLTDEGGQLRGLTESETIELLDRFGVFIETVKKNGSVTPTLPLSSERKLYQELPTKVSDTSDSSASA